MRDRLTWKKQTSETGLARVCQRERGFDLRINGVRVVHVAPCFNGFGRSVVGWYWYGGSEQLGIPSKNTAGNPRATADDARAEAESHVRTALGMPEKRVRKGKVA